MIDFNDYFNQANKIIKVNIGLFRVVVQYIYTYNSLIFTLLINSIHIRLLFTHIVANVCLNPSKIKCFIFVYLNRHNTTTKLYKCYLNMLDMNTYFVNYVYT